MTLWTGARRFSAHVFGLGKRRKRINPAVARAAQFACEQLEKRVLLSTVTWTATSSGQWSNPANWSGDALPGATDDVVINQSNNITVTSTGSVSVNSITVTGDTLEVSGGGITVAANSSLDSNSTLLLDGGNFSVGGGATFTLNGSATWSAATIGGSGTFAIASGATLTLTGAGIKDFDTLDVENSGTITDNGGGTKLNGGGWQFSTSAILNDDSGGSIVMNTVEPILSEGGALNVLTGSTFVSNDGTAVDIALDNEGGTIDAEGGLLSLAGGGTNTGGAYDANGQAVVDLTGGSSPSFAGTFTGTGTGTVEFSSGTLYVGAGGATFDFDPGLFQWNGGVINVSGNTLTNAGTITVTPTNPLVLESFSAPPGTFINSGTIVQDQASSITGIIMESDVAVENASTGIFKLNGDGSIGAQGGDETFTNSGTVEKIAGTGTSLFFGVLDNLAGGQWVGQTGTLSASNNSGGEWVGGANFTIATGATIDFGGGGPPTIGGTFTGTGGGTVVFEGGGIAVAGATFNFSGNMLQVAGSIDVGSFDGATYGNFTNLGTMDVTTDVQIFGNATFTNDGTFIISGGGLFVGGLDVPQDNSVNFINAANASFLIEGDFGVTNFQGEPTTLSNNGLVEKVSGTGTSTIAFGNINDNGTIEALTGTIALVGSGLGGPVGGFGVPSFIAAAGTTIDLTGMNGASFPFGGWTGDLSGSGAGQVIDTDGTIFVPNFWLNLDFPAGMLQLTAPNINLNGNTLTNYGSITFLPDNTQSPANYGDFNGAGTVENYSGFLNNNYDSTITFQGGVGNFYIQDGSDPFPVQPPSDISIDNMAGATIDFDGDASIIPDPSLGDPFLGTLTNEGEILKSAGSSVSELGMDFTNSATITADAGTIQLDNPEPLVAGTNWNVLNGSSITMPNSPGYFADDTANLTLSGAGATLGTLASDLNTIEVNASLTLGDGATLEVAGNLTVVGNSLGYDNGQTNFIIDGSPASNLFGQLIVDGTFTYNGITEINYGDGYAGVVGDAYNLITYKGNTDITGIGSLNDDPTISFNFFASVGNGLTGMQATVATESADLTPALDGPVPTSGTVGQPITINFEDDNFNQANPTNVSNWTDSVYLSPDGTFDASSILLGTVAQTQQVQGFGSLAASLTADVPALVPGNYNITIVTDSGDQVADSNRANNTVTFANPISIGMPPISMGQTIATTVAAGQDLYFVLNNPAQLDEMVSAVTDVAGAASIFVSNDAVPTPTQSDLNSSGQSGTTINVPVINQTTGPYIVLVQGNASAGAGVGLNLTASKIGFQIASVSPASVTNAAPATITINGFHFTSATTATLTSGGTTLVPTNIQFVNSQTLEATFNFPAALPESYDLNIFDSGQSATAKSAVTVSAATSTWTGTYSTSQHWVAGGIYIVSGTAEFASGATLTIDPGAIVKFDPGAGILIDADATLSAVGTLAQPIIFTSIKDDANGGDTNGDGNSTQPAAGDWGGITVTGSANFDNAQILYSTNAIVNQGQTVNFTNGRIYQAFNDAYYCSTGGAVGNITNTVIDGCDKGAEGHGGSLTITNCTIVNCRFGVRGAGLVISVINSIVDNSSEFGIFGGGVTVEFSDVFSTIAGSVDYSGLPILTNIDGNISNDPEFVNAANLDYQLGYTSPAIDAADGNFSPLTDALGDPRYNDPRVAIETGIPDANGNYPDMGAFEFVEAAPSNLDLVVTNVTGPTMLTAGQPAVVTWTEQNIGTGTVTGSWHDDIELVDPTAVGGPVTLDAGAVLSTATIGPNGSTLFTATVAVPYGTEGTYYWQVHADSDGAIFEGANTTNNTTASTNPSQLALTTLAAGQTIPGTFSTVGSPIIYKIVTTPGQDLSLSLNRSDTGGVTDLYLGEEVAPTTQNFLTHVNAYSNATAQIDIVTPGTSTFYLMLIPQSLPSGFANYTLTATATVGVALNSIGLSTGADTGQVTIPLVGANFQSGMTASLLGPSNSVINATSVQIVDSAHAFATFNFNGAADTTYGVQVAQGSSTATLPAAFTLQPPAPANAVQIKILLPPAVREGRLFVAYVVYSNTGTTDIQSPIIYVTSPTGNTMSLTQTGALTSTVDFMALSQNGPAGILLPGQSFSMPIYVMGQAGNNQIAASYSVPNNAAFNWSTLETQIEPATPDPDWATTFTNDVTAAGPSNADYLTLLSNIATTEAQRTGTLTYDPGQLLGQYIQDQVDYENTSLQGTVYLGDTSTPLAGALVTAVNVATDQGYTAFSLANGVVQFQSLPAGSYIVDAQGYLPAGTQTPIAVTAAGPATGSWLFEQGADIVGKVIAPAGVDLTTETVSAVDANGNTFGASVTAQGAFDIAGLPAGTYTVSVSGPAPIALPGSILDVDATAGQITTLSNMVVTGGATISGSLTDSTNSNALVDALVTFTSTSDGSISQSVLTDANGNFSISTLPGGTYTITGTDAGYASGTLNSVLVETGGTTANQQIALVPQASVFGHVFSGNHNVPGAFVTVSVGSTLFDSTYTDSNGDYTLANLPAGPYNFLITAPVNASFGEQLNLTPGQNLNLNVALGSTSLIQGTVTLQSTGAPIPGASIYLIEPDGQTEINTVTSSDGTYSFGNLNPGQYTVMLPDGSHRQTVTITSGADVETANYVLSLGALHGFVLQTDGVTPDTQAMVLLMKNGQVVDETGVESDGGYTFSIISPGTYQVTATDGQSTFASQTVTVVEGAETQVPLLQPATGSLQLAVTSADTSAPFTTQGVAVLRPLNLPIAFAGPMTQVISPDGTVSFANLAPGSYLLSVAIPGVTQSAQVITIAAGENNLPISVGDAGDIIGNVSNSGSAPLTNITVTAYDPANPNATFQVYTDANGNYSLGHLPVGTYTLIFTDDLNGAYAYSTVTGVAVTSAATTTQNVVMQPLGTTVTGVITDGAGNTPAGGTVIALNSDGVQVATTSVALDGSYSLATLTAGTYTLRAQVQGFVVPDITLTIGAHQATATANFAATWYIDPDVSASSAFDGFITQVKQLLSDVRLVFAGPTEADPLGPEIMTDCACQAAIDSAAWYQRAVLLDNIAHNEFSSVYESWSAGLKIVGNDAALYGVQLAVLVSQLAILAASGPITAASAATAMEEGAANALQQFADGKLALAAGQFADQAAAQQGVVAAIKFIASPTNAANLAVNLSSYLISCASSTVNPFADFANDISTLTTDIGFYSGVKSSGPEAAQAAWETVTNDVQNIFMNDLPTIGGIFASIGQTVNLVVTTLGKAVAATALGIVSQVASTFVAGVQTIKDAYHSIQDYLNTYDQYLSIIIKRDQAKANSDSLAAACNTNCNDDPPTITPPPAVPQKPVPPPPGVPNASSVDPNDKTTIGVGTAGFIAPNQTITYTVDFENDPTAAEPAQEVVITDQLSSNLDWSTLQLDTIDFNGVSIDVPAGLQHFSTQVDVSTDSHPVDVTANFNPTTGVLTYTMESIDVITGLLTLDPSAGFLPPDNAEEQGEGDVTYSVTPAASLADGTVIDNQASVVFDTNAPILTPTAVNTIDAAPPTSSVLALPTNESSTTFNVSWSGNDGTGSGIASYNIYVSDNGAPYSLFQQDTANTSATFTGVNGHTYSFYSVATDNVGNVQPTPAGAQTSTTVSASTTLLTPVFTNLNASTPTITYGTNSVIFSGNIADGAQIPSGETVAVTLNGITQQATIQSNGNFTTTFTTSTLPVAAQSYAVTFNYTGDATFNGISDNTTVTLAVTPATATVTLGNLNQTYDGSPEFATSTTGPTGLAVTYVYTQGATVVTNPTNAGSYTVTATINDPNYVGSATETLTIAKATTTVTLGNLNQTYDGSPEFATSTTAPNGLAVTYVYTQGATIVAGPTNAGSYTVTATINDPNYQGSATETLTIAKANTTVTLGSLNQTYDGSPEFATSITAPTGLAVTYVYTQGATVVASPTNAGSYTVTATINDPNYQGTSTETLTIAKETTTVTLGNLNPTYDGSPEFATSITAPTGLAVTYVYTQGNTVATNPTNAGSYTVTATINDPNYQGTSTQTLTIAQATQAITFNALPGVTFGVSPITLSATSTSQLPVAFSVFSGPGSLNGNILTVTGAGTIVIDAAQLGSSNYLPAPVIPQNLVVAQAPATLSFTGNLNPTYDGTAKSIGVTTTPPNLTGVSIVYTQGTNVVATPTAAGTYNIVATLNNTNYTATPLDGSLIIAKASPVFTNLTTPSTITFGATSATFSGTIAAGAISPVGETIAVTLNGITQNATILANDTFTTTFNTTTLPASATPYVVAYAYTADANFNSVTNNTTTTLTVNAPAPVATHFSVTASSTEVAGVPISFTVTALDSSNNPVTGYTGTVHFTSSDAQAALPANATLTSGVGTFSTTLKTAGNQSITATDTASAITGSDTSITVTPSTATHFTVVAPTAATAGSPINITVTALDAFGNIATGYAGTIHFTSTDVAAVLPANATLTNGVGTFSATLKTAANETITATDTVTTSIVGSTSSIAVAPSTATHFTVVAPTAATAGTAFNFTVTALDAFGNTATGYTGTIHFTSSDAAAALPANATLTKGIATFSATLNTAANQTITATDTTVATITGTTSPILVSAVTTAAEKLVFYIPPTSGQAGGLNTIIVLVENSKGQIVLSDHSTVTLSVVTGPGALGGNVSVKTSLGVAVFNNLSLTKAGLYTLKATDGTDTTITSSLFTITPANAAKLVFNQEPTSTSAGNTLKTITVDVEDQFGNIVTTDSSLVTLSTNAKLNGTSSVHAVNGVATFSNLSINTAGNYQLYASDGHLSPAISTPFTIAPGVATHMAFILLSPNTPKHAKAFEIQVAMLDAFGNIATADNSTVTLSLSTTHPKNATLTGTLSATVVNGIATLNNLFLSLAGQYTLIATDSKSIASITSPLFSVS